ncbi:DUF645 family protein [Vibrio cholerae]|nr:DUF645 family protein [Vibrio cholerae]EJL6909348.1 DUF645 family protein [Vibrio cholerae]ELF6907130.1 DUF645 family protein [Vibrio cholerae]
MLSDAPHGKFGITKAASSLKLFFLLSRTLNRATSTLIVLNFGSQLHSFWR